jgi:hypothetical protein
MLGSGIVALDTPLFYRMSNAYSIHIQVNQGVAERDHLMAVKAAFTPKYAVKAAFTPNGPENGSPTHTPDERRDC